MYDLFSFLIKQILQKINCHWILKIIKYIEIRLIWIISNHFFLNLSRKAHYIKYITKMFNSALSFLLLKKYTDKFVLIVFMYFANIHLVILIVFLVEQILYFKITLQNLNYKIMNCYYKDLVCILTYKYSDYVKCSVVILILIVFIIERNKLGLKL